MKLLSILALTLILGQSTMAAKPEINFKCSSKRKNIEFQIKNNLIKTEGRMPAQSITGRTSKVGNSVTNHYSMGGQKFQIHFDDITDSNEMNTYISIRTDKGHEVTYPLNCEAL
ncbi:MULTISPECIES: hypothetical protein [Halobacteriovorax]|uniref:Uncharacterized protein n=1 Tax=Halobacteriovorax vibrionivorans TaxID=2152716 RepID=A0ABY0IK01_9BACT|nr:MULTISPECIES: hypothetical protein [Halobacteriovorax]RZF21879.1 hypothetical protein DAY19_09320 [Halobacteriovorax vibrionivorans]TGD45836.1 hypothetical protein EP118_14525 [Halobacteriovorax sp. Y22]